MLPKINLEII